MFFNSSGDLFWYKTWGGSEGDYGYGIVIDVSGNIYITGYTYSNGDEHGEVFLLKYEIDENGSFNSYIIQLISIIMIVSILTISLYIIYRNRDRIAGKFQRNTNIYKTKDTSKPFKKISIEEIEEKVNHGAYLVETARKSFDSAILMFQDQLFDDAIQIFNEQLENIIEIPEIYKREKLRNKILDLIYYTKILKTKSIIISLGSHHSQLKIIEIFQKSHIDERLIIRTINEMIENNIGAKNPGRVNSYLERRVLDMTP